MRYVVPWLPVCVMPVCVMMAGCGSTVSVPGMVSHPADAVSIVEGLIDIRLEAVQTSSQPMWELFSRQVSEHPGCPQVRLEWRQRGFAKRFRLEYDQASGTLLFEVGRGGLETHRGVTRTEMREVRQFLVAHRPKMLDRAVAASASSVGEALVQ